MRLEQPVYYGGTRKGQCGLGSKLDDPDRLGDSAIGRVTIGRVGRRLEFRQGGISYLDLYNARPNRCHREPGRSTGGARILRN